MSGGWGSGRGDGGPWTTALVTPHGALLIPYSRLIGLPSIKLRHHFGTYLGHTLNTLIAFQFFIHGVNEVSMS